MSRNNSKKAIHLYFWKEKKNNKNNKIKRKAEKNDMNKRWLKTDPFTKVNRAFYRSSHRRCSVRKGSLRNFAKFTGKHLYQSLFFNKVAGLTLFSFLRIWLHLLKKYSMENFLFFCSVGDCFWIYFQRNNHM